jgi:hypothetical protein
MTDALDGLARAMSASPIHPLVLNLLSNVPGFPPLVQTVHLLSISAVMGSIVLIDLKVLGLALPSQPTGDLVRRLMPWMWSSLPLLALSGMVFIFARPASYFVNPVFRAKFTLLPMALVLALVFHLAVRRDLDFWERSRGRRLSARLIAAVSLVLWIGVALAGRWIAYADYLFPDLGL